jgi:molybdopterin converting factor small subunit
LPFVVSVDEDHGRRVLLAAHPGGGALAHVRLRAPLKELAGGRTEHELAGSTVAGVLQELERSFPPLAGWVLDERGRIRQHVNVFVNGEYGREETIVGPDDRIQVIPSISGG